MLVHLLVKERRKSQERVVLTYGMTSIMLTNLPRHLQLVPLVSVETCWDIYDVVLLMMVMVHLSTRHEGGEGESQAPGDLDGKLRSEQEMRHGGVGDYQMHCNDEFNGT